MLGRLLREIANLAKRNAAIDGVRLQGWSLLAQSRDLQARVAPEPGQASLRNHGAASIREYVAHP